jgi:hypothetical protein
MAPVTVGYVDQPPAGLSRFDYANGTTEWSSESNGFDCCDRISRHRDLIPLELSEMSVVAAVRRVFAVLAGTIADFVNQIAGAARWRRPSAGQAPPPSNPDQA